MFKKKVTRAKAATAPQPPQPPHIRTQPAEPQLLGSARQRNNNFMLNLSYRNDNSVHRNHITPTHPPLPPSFPPPPRPPAPSNPSLNPRCSPHLRSPLSVLATHIPDQQPNTSRYNTTVSVSIIPVSTFTIAPHFPIRDSDCPTLTSFLCSLQSLVPLLV